MTTQHQQWEYHRLYLSVQDDMLGKLSELGERGWELVATLPNGPTFQNHWFIFKRPKQ